MRKVKFGVVGGGGAFYFHANGIRNSEILEYTAIYDVNYENAKRHGEKISKQSYDGLRNAGRDVRQ